MLGRLESERIIRREARHRIYCYEIVSEFLVGSIVQRRIAREAARAEAVRREEAERQLRRCAAAQPAAALDDCALALGVLAAGCTRRLRLSAEARSEPGPASPADRERRPARRTLGAHAQPHSAVARGDRRCQRTARRRPRPEPRSPSARAAEPARRARRVARHRAAPERRRPRGHRTRPCERAGVGRAGIDDGTLRDPSGRLRLRVDRAGGTGCADRVRVVSRTCCIRSRANSSSVALSPTGAVFATGSTDGSTQVWSASDASLRATLVGETSRVAHVSFSHDGRWLVAGGDDGVTHIWDVRSSRQLSTLGPAGAVTYVAFADADRQVVTQGSDGRVRRWQSGRAESVATACSGAVVALALGSAHDDGRGLRRRSSARGRRPWRAARRRSSRRGLSGPRPYRSPAASWRASVRTAGSAWSGSRTTRS